MPNEWPVLLPASKQIFTWTVPGSNTRLRLRQGAAGLVLIHFATRFDRWVEDLDEPVLDDWGYAYRPVRGYAVWSNHARAVAMDLNATGHPLGVRNTFSPEEERRIESLLTQYDDCIVWGGHYRNRADEMHLDLIQDRARVRKLARSLIDTKRGRAVLAVNPGQRELIVSGR